MREIYKFLILIGLVQLCWSQAPPICASGVASSNCTTVWFSCTQAGTASITGLGLEFSQFQPVTRWKVSSPRYENNPLFDFLQISKQLEKRLVC